MPSFSSLSNYGEYDLIAHACQRDPEAWTIIYQDFSGPIFGFLFNQLRNREEAEDLTGTVFLEAMQAVHRFSGDLPALRAWMFRIARNNLIDHFRRSNRARLEPLEEANEADVTEASAAEDPEALALGRIEQSQVLEAIGRLSPDQREVILLRLTGGLTSQEVADILGKTYGAVKALQHRAISALARTLAGAPEKGRRG